MHCGQRDFSFFSDIQSIYHTVFLCTLIYYLLYNRGFSLHTHSPPVCLLCVHFLCMCVSVSVCVCDKSSSSSLSSSSSSCFVICFHPPHPPNPPPSHSSPPLTHPPVAIVQTKAVVRHVAHISLDLSLKKKTTTNEFHKKYSHKK